MPGSALISDTGQFAVLKPALSHRNRSPLPFSGPFGRSVRVQPCAREHLKVVCGGFAG